MNSNAAVIHRRTFSIGALALTGFVVGRGRRSISATAHVPKRLLLVPDRSQQIREPVLLKSESIAALREGGRKIGRALPNDIEIVMPYYLDVFDRSIARLRIPLVSELQVRRTREEEELFSFQAQLAEQLRQRLDITDEVVNREYGANRMPKALLNWWWVQAILRAIERYGPGMTKHTLETFTRDVFLYATRPEIRNEVEAFVSQHLIGEATVVIGHSLGSVVAFEILRSERQAIEVPLYASVGCPLGIPVLRNVFLPAGARWRVSTEWYNAFDLRDCLAQYPLDAAYFPITPPVENYSAVRNPTSDRHGIVGYLDHPRVIEKILGALGA